MHQSLYRKEYFSRFGELAALNHEAYLAYIRFCRSAMAPKYIPAKIKELIAVAVSHITCCPYCINIHVTGAKRLGATVGEITESIFVATALKAGSAMAHSVNALNAFDELEGDLYQNRYIERLNEIKALAGDSFNDFFRFDVAAMKPGALSVKEKELIAVASAHVTGCPYCIDTHVKNAKKLGVTREELCDCIFVAISAKAGAAAAQAVNAMMAYDG